MLHLTIRAVNGDGFDERGLRQVHRWTDLSGAVCAYGYEAADARWIRWPGFAAFRFAAAGATDAYPERVVDSARLQAFFHRIVEPLVFQAIGWETLHASAIVGPAGLVAFCGDREAGKSTIAYSLSRRGYRQFADDAVVLQPGPRGVLALRLPFGVRLRRESAGFFGFPPDHQEPQDILPLVHPDAGSVPTEPLSSLFVLTGVPSGELRVERLGPGSAFSTLLAHAHCFNPNDAAARQRVVRHYLEITAAVPVYELRFPRGLDRLDAVLACIEETVGDACVATPA